MNIVFFAHPDFLGHQSMPRFANVLAEGMNQRGHKVAIWSPQPLFFQMPLPKLFKKWMGYIDQYVIFPQKVRSRLKKCPSNTLFVFTDNGLGIWVPLVMNRPHVIHCHDFLAQRSALGEIEENQITWTGRQYQKLIRHGFRQGKHFIPTSQKTKEDLHRFLAGKPFSSKLVYNFLNQPFSPIDASIAKDLLAAQVKIDLKSGYLLHVGGNQWYKNRKGVIEIYDAWRSTVGSKLPLILIGEPPSPEIMQVHAQSLYKSEIYFLSGIEDSLVRLAYSGASVFIFPSLAEGFGWPIAEAMASGCPVITTDEAPMTEVAGNAGFFIPRRPNHARAISWATDAAKVVSNVLGLSPENRQSVLEKGLLNVQRFKASLIIDELEVNYKSILQSNKMA
ncbi:glycosyltransferase [Adhaeribacter radiodurans]|uniref:Glycosyltransferase n=1 Tax=Adhaeribacter radiodurans TaxID=2745197 RepID=A0A7L7L3P4_9BACT|nr:glycosyltransferase [Adhaeribacter radiodurans]QMU27432.1 glycosyltransferase [Adhaeribacter radiodurans]